MTDTVMGELQIFIPVYNEFSAVSRLNYNLNRALKVFPSIRFHFHDNASTDGTYEYILDLQRKYPEFVFVERNQTNIGFSRNLCNIDRLPKDRMILILGANDLLFTPGLRELKRILMLDHYDLIVTNWAYARTAGSRGRVRILSIRDVKAPFCVNTLDDYFEFHRAVPNGIMQWVIHPKHACLFARHTRTLSPQLGAFFDLFPGKVYAMGNPPLTIVNQVEDDGWRSSVERVLETHVAVSSATILSLNENLKRRKISVKTYARVRYFYTWVIIYFAHRAFTTNYWGDWKRKEMRRLASVWSIVWGALTMRPNPYLNWIFLSAVAINVLAGRLFASRAISKERSSPVRRS